LGEEAHAWDTLSKTCRFDECVCFFAAVDESALTEMETTRRESALLAAVDAAERETAGAP
jgi:hypothetical protein